MNFKLVRFIKKRDGNQDSLYFQFLYQERHYFANVPESSPHYEKWNQLAVGYFQASQMNHDIYLENPELKPGTVELVADQELIKTTLPKESVFVPRPVKTKRDWSDNEKD